MGAHGTSQDIGDLFALQSPISLITVLVQLIDNVDI